MHPDEYTFYKGIMPAILAALEAIRDELKRSNDLSEAVRADETNLRLAFEALGRYVKTASVSTLDIPEFLRGYTTVMDAVDRDDPQPLSQVPVNLGLACRAGYMTALKDLGLWPIDSTTTTETGTTP